MYLCFSMSSFKWVYAFDTIRNEPIWNDNNPLSICFCFYCVCNFQWIQILIHLMMILVHEYLICYEFFFFIDKNFFRFWTVCIPIGTNCAPPLTNPNKWASQKNVKRSQPDLLISCFNI